MPKSTQFHHDKELSLLSHELTTTVRGEAIDLTATASPTRGLRRPTGESAVSESSGNPSFISSAVSFTRGDIPRTSWLFILIQTLSNLGTLVFGVVLLSIAYRPEDKNHFFTDVDDIARCPKGFTATFQTNDQAFSLSLLIISTLFCFFFGVRAVVMEKDHLLLLFCMLQFIISAQMLTFTFSEMEHDVFPETAVYASRVVSVTLSAVNMLLVVSTYWVNKSFGWRMYLRGFTEAQSVISFRLFGVFDAFIKADAYLTSALLLSLAFFEEDTLFARVVLSVLGVMTMLMSFLVTRAVRSERSMIVWAWMLMCLIHPPYQIYTTIELQTSITNGVPGFCQHELNCFRRAANCTVPASNGTNSPAPPPNTTYAPNESNTSSVTPECTQKLCCNPYADCVIRYNRFRRVNVILFATTATWLLIRAVAIYLAYQNLVKMGRGMKETWARAEKSIKQNTVFEDLKKGFQIRYD